MRKATARNKIGTHTQLGGAGGGGKQGAPSGYFVLARPLQAKMGVGEQQAKQWHCAAAEDEAALRKKALTKLTRRQSTAANQMNKAAWDCGGLGGVRLPRPLPPACHLYIMSLWLYTWPYIQTQVRKCVCVCLCVCAAESKTKQKKMATPHRKETRCDKKHDDAHRAFFLGTAGSMYK